MSSTKTLEERAEAAHLALQKMRRHFRFSAWVTLIVGGLLLAVVAIYFSFGYHEVSDLTDPDKIVALVGQTVDDQLPIYRQQAEQQVKDNASTWAEQASQQLLTAIPPMREHLEQFALDQSDTIIAQIDVVGEQQFRRLLNENRSTVEEAIKDLKNDEDISEDVLVALQLAIEKELQIDSSSQADAVLTIASDLNKNMEELVAGEGLTREQKAERRVLMLAKRLQKERFGDAEFELSLPALDGIVGEMEEKRIRKDGVKPASQAKPDEPADKPKETAKPAPKAEKPAEKPKAADKPAEKPKEPAKPAPKAEKPAEKPKAADKPAEKPKEPAKPAPKAEKPAGKPKAADKPAEKPKEAAKPAPKAEKPAEKPKAADKPAEKPKEASKPEAKADKPAEKS